MQMRKLGLAIEQLRVPKNDLMSAFNFGTSLSGEFENSVSDLDKAEDDDSTAVDLFLIAFQDSP